MGSRDLIRVASGFATGLAGAFLLFLAIYYAPFQNGSTVSVEAGTFWIVSSLGALVLGVVSVRHRHGFALIGIAFVLVAAVLVLIVVDDPSRIEAL